MATIGKYTRQRLIRLIDERLKDPLEAAGVANPCSCATEPIGEGETGTIPAGYEADLPKQGAEAAIAELTFANVSRGFDYDITIISTDTTSRKYIPGTTGTNGASVTGGVRFLKDRSPSVMAENLKEAIESSNGHGVSRLVVTLDGSKMSLRQATSGQAGNTVIKNNMYSVNEGSSVKFTGGRNDDGYYVLGDLVAKGTGHITEKHETRYGTESSVKKTGDHLTLSNSTDDGDIRLEVEGEVISDADIHPATNEGASLGKSDQKWDELHVKTSNVGDLHLKNERGDWTIIEEEDYLTMRNNKTGNLFKILMEPLN